MQIVYHYNWKNLDLVCISVLKYSSNWLKILESDAKSFIGNPFSDKKMLSRTSMSCFKSWLEIKKSDRMIFNLFFDDFLKSNLWSGIKVGKRFILIAQLVMGNKIQYCASVVGNTEKTIGTSTRVKNLKALLDC